MGLEDKKGGQPGTEILVINKGIIPLGRPEHAVGERRIRKDALSIISFWFGRRLLDYSDLSAFNTALSMYRAFPLTAHFDIPEIQDVEGEDNRQLLKLVGRDLAREMEVVQGPLVAFITVTGDLIDNPWLDRFPQNLQKYRQDQGRDATFVYKLIVGGETYDNLPEGVRGNISANFWRHELQALQCGGVYLCYETDYYTRSSKRIVELMNRLVGADLPGREFPNYTLADAARIAWSINREDFTLMREEKDAPPKYPIVNGRPKFPF